MSDEELVERIRLGNEQAAEILVRRYYTAILRYCRTSCGNADQAEDLTQETFLRLFRSLSEHKEKIKLRPFLYTIAHHLCIDESRKLRQCPLKDQQTLVDEHDGLRQAEDRAEVNRLLAVLPPEQREAVILRYGQSLSFRQIALVMGCNLRTAQSRVRRALKSMREAKSDEN